MQNIPIPHSISLIQAIELTTRLREDRPHDVPICETFEKESVMMLLEEKNAEKFRIYYGRKENGEICAVLVAADAAGNDIIPEITELDRNDGENEELILEDSYRCPYLCPPESPLNT